MDFASLIRILPPEMYVFLGALVGLLLVYLVRKTEIRRGEPVGGILRERLDIAVMRLGRRTLEGGDEALQTAYTLPRVALWSTIHTLALLALSLLRQLERLLKRTIDSVRGRREVTTGDKPASAFLAHIIPARRPKGPEQR